MEISLGVNVIPWEFRAESKPPVHVPNLISIRVDPNN